ncbi:hypothetical protein HDV05_008241 [Chytridiales sp. JEL 0842]|nr:hypothetical protein HDV05_008241 [Chytridiales sp. JEL 0842]
MNTTRWSILAKWIEELDVGIKFIVCMIPIYAILVLGWSVIGPNFTWSTYYVIAWPTFALYGLCAPAWVLSSNPERSFWRNYVFALVAYVYVVAQAFIVGLIISFLLYVSAFTAQLLDTTSVGEALQDIKVIASFLYIGLAFPILKVLIILTQNMSPALQQNAKMNQKVYIDAIITKIKMSLGYRCLIGTVEMVILFRIKLHVFVIGICFAKAIDVCRRLLLDYWFIKWKNRIRAEEGNKKEGVVSSAAFERITTEKEGLGPMENEVTTAKSAVLQIDEDGQRVGELIKGEIETAEREPQHSNDHQLQKQTVTTTTTATTILPTNSKPTVSIKDPTTETNFISTTTAITNPTTLQRNHISNSITQRTYTFLVSSTLKDVSNIEKHLGPSFAFATNTWACSVADFATIIAAGKIHFLTLSTMKALFLPALIALLPSASAWFAAQHHLTGRIAQAFLHPETVQGLNELLSEFNGNASAATTWADDVRATPEYAWSSNAHFVNALVVPRNDTNATFPRPTCEVLLPRDCPEGTVCVVRGVQNYTSRALPHDSHTKETRNEAIKFLLHFIGDGQQPLHNCAKLRGGNDWTVKWNGSELQPPPFNTSAYRLHFIWDGVMSDTDIQLNYNSSIDAYYNSIITDLTTGSYASESQSWISCPEPFLPDPSISTTPIPSVCPLAWANEATSFNCETVWENVGPNPDGSKADLFLNGYFEKNKEEVRKRIAVAGVRMAAILNAVVPKVPMDTLITSLSPPVGGGYTVPGATNPTPTEGKGYAPSATKTNEASVTTKIGYSGAQSLEGASSLVGVLSIAAAYFAII